MYAAYISKTFIFSLFCNLHVYDYMHNLIIFAYILCMLCMYNLYFTYYMYIWDIIYSVFLELQII